MATRTYAAGRRTLVRLAHTPDWTEVEVTTAGTTDAVSAPAAPLDGGPHVSGGRGLAGLRERVEMLGASSRRGPSPRAGSACTHAPRRAA
ncbi:hypothetical protein [Streptomyces viridosporus]|uniref:hypothetical protein n=1 Tax=Streptomyces viridosporus TaxID=67581 RepID=UPI0009C18D79|nr:hypothetical protein [Streptomyces viridosporus]